MTIQVTGTGIFLYIYNYNREGKSRASRGKRERGNCVFLQTWNIPVDLGGFCPKARYKSKVFCFPAIVRQIGLWNWIVSKSGLLSSSSLEESGREGEGDSLPLPSLPPRRSVLHGLFVSRSSYLAPGTRYYVRQITQQIRNEIKPARDHPSL